MCKENEPEARYVVDRLLLTFEWFNNHHSFINYHFHDIPRNGNSSTCCYNSYYNGSECVREYLITYSHLATKSVKDLF